MDYFIWTTGYTPGFFSISNFNLSDVEIRNLGSNRYKSGKQPIFKLHQIASTDTQIPDIFFGVGALIFSNRVQNILQRRNINSFCAARILDQSNSETNLSYFALTELNASNNIDWFKSSADDLSEVKRVSELRSKLGNLHGLHLINAGASMIISNDVFHHIVLIRKRLVDVFLENNITGLCLKNPAEIKHISEIHFKTIDESRNQHSLTDLVLRNFSNVIEEYLAGYRAAQMKDEEEIEEFIDLFWERYGEASFYKICGDKVIAPDQLDKEQIQNFCNTKLRKLLIG